MKKIKSLIKYLWKNYKETIIMIILVIILTYPAMIGFERIYNKMIDKIELYIKIDRDLRI